ncbi:MAG: response regulator [Deltaproteobacteria bacterium]|nr:response regulator [Deltaproteobacteria bacterium]
MAVVLIVEDDQVLRAAMARGLSKLSGVRVEEAGTLLDARTKLETMKPDVVLSDIDLPDGSGLELVEARERAGSRCPLVFVSAYLSSYGHQVPKHAGVEVREKPLSLSDLRDIVTERLKRPEKSAPGPFAVTDYVQLACMGRRSVLIEVIGSDQKELGRIVIASGVLWAARDVQGHGVDAFRRLVFQTMGQPQVHSLDAEPGTRDIHAGWEHVLLESARVSDEAQREPASLDLGTGDLTGDALASTAADTLESTPMMPSGTKEEDRGDLPPAAMGGSSEHRERAIGHALDGDLVAAAREIAADHSRGPTEISKANLERLAELGVVIPPG